MNKLITTLQLKEHKELVVLGAPVNLAVVLDGLSGIKVHHDVTEIGQVEAAVVFATTQTELAAAADAILPKAQGDPLIWFCLSQAHVQTLQM